MIDVTLLAPSCSERTASQIQKGANPWGPWAKIPRNPKGTVGPNRDGVVICLDGCGKRYQAQRYAGSGSRIHTTQ